MDTCKLCVYLVLNIFQGGNQMSSLINNIVTNSVKFANELYDTFQIEYIEPTNVFDAYIVLASIL